VHGSGGLTVCLFAHHPPIAWSSMRSVAPDLARPHTDRFGISVAGLAAIQSLYRHVGWRGHLRSPRRRSGCPTRRPSRVRTRGPFTSSAGRCSRNRGWG